MAVRSLVKEFSEETTCPVCLEYFTDPVITGCGHNFCRACLTQCWREPDRNASSCPQCREPLQQRNLKPNRQLANIVELTKKLSLQEAKGTEGAGGGVCERHQEPLKLFCRDDEAPICVVCDRSKEHREHRVIPTDEAAEEYKEKIQTQLQFLEKEREKLVEQKEFEEQWRQEYLKQLEVDKQQISVFKFKTYVICCKEILVGGDLVHSCLTQQLDKVEKKIKEREEENMTRLSEEISHFSDLIKDVEEKCQQPASEFLQDIRCTLSRCQEGQMRKQVELSPGLEWRLRGSCPKKSVLKKAMEEFEGLNSQAPSKVSVTLDPDTAHPRLVLSEDLKSVKWEETYQKLPDNPERFDCMRYVLGHERFTSGRHCWEVEVEKLKEGERWAVGVARESVKRKGRFLISPNEGSWAVGKAAFRGHPLWALSPPGEGPWTPFTPNWIPLTFSRQPRKIRVFLDYEEGRVEFFDADTNHLIFTFTPGSFSGEEIRPFFMVEVGVCLHCRI